MVKIKITSTVITAQYGTLTAGDVLNTNEAFAKHLVEECCAAKYETNPAQSDEAPAKRQPSGKSKKTI